MESNDRQIKELQSIAQRVAKDLNKVSPLLNTIMAGALDNVPPQQAEEMRKAAKEANNELKQNLNDLKQRFKDG